MTKFNQENTSTIRKETCIDCGIEKIRNIQVFQEPFWGECFSLCKDCINKRRSNNFSLRYIKKLKINSSGLLKYKQKLCIENNVPMPTCTMADIRKVLRNI